VGGVNEGEGRGRTGGVGEVLWINKRFIINRRRVDVQPPMTR